MIHKKLDLSNLMCVYITIYIFIWPSYDGLYYGVAFVRLVSGVLTFWFPLNMSKNNWPSLTQFSMEVHLDNLQAKFDYFDLDLIFKVMVAIMFLVDLVSAQYV